MRVLQPGRIGPLQLPNRLVRSATSETMATDEGGVTDDLVALHTGLAAGGVGLAILGHAYVDRRGQSQPNQTGIHDDSLIPGLRQLTEAVHDAGGRIFAQLAHAGSQTSMPDIDPLAPSPVANPLTGRRPDAASDPEIEATIEAFGAAAGRAVEAGFDGIHIHAANGYLISEFSSPSANTRTDRWGGSPDRRSRFLLAVYEAVRAAAGTDLPVTAKVGMVDQGADGLRLDESVYRVAELASRGLDGVEVSVGVMQSGTASCVKYVGVDRRRAVLDLLLPRVLSPAAPEAYFEAYARAVKERCPDLAVLLVGGLRSTEVIERVLGEGSCDFACLSRPLIREPDLPVQIRDGRRGAVDCTSCNLCLDTEGRYPLRCWRSPKSRLLQAAAMHLTDAVRGGR